MATKPKSIHQTTKHMTKAERDAREQAESRIKSVLAEIKPPTWLNAAQKRRFRTFVQQMAGLELLTILDANHLARYVYLEERFIQLNDAIQCSTFTVEGKINPLLVEQRQVHAAMEKLESKLGMNPSDRLRFVQLEQPKADELEEFKRELS